MLDELINSMAQSADKSSVFILVVRPDGKPLHVLIDSVDLKAHPLGGEEFYARYMRPAVLAMAGRLVQGSE